MEKTRKIGFPATESGRKVVILVYFTFSKRPILADFLNYCRPVCHLHGSSIVNKMALAIRGRGANDRKLAMSLFSSTYPNENRKHHVKKQI